MSKGKQKTGTARLLELAATKKYLVVSSVILSALASVVSFVPYLAIYLIVCDILGALPDMTVLDSARVIRYGWLAFAGAAGNVILYFAALVCSHLAAFDTLYILKVNFASHLARVPLGMHVTVGSGKLRKIMDENIEKVEGFIAHQLPDLAAAFTSPVVMVVILLSVDWRFGLAAMLGIALAFYAQFSMYGNEKSRKMMEDYMKALEDMNNASVEYIRGISVIKAFTQTKFSFRRLHDAIRAYTTMVIPYTLSWENSFSGFLTLVNNIYLFVVPVGILVGMHSADYAGFAGKFIFYMLFTPAVASILTKIMYVNSNAMRIIGEVRAMDEILSEPELAGPERPQPVSGHDIEFRGVSFSYDTNKETEALANLSFKASQGEITALVGPSGGGKSTIAHLIPRFFDVAKGQILIGGVDVREMDISCLMDNVSFVFQDVFLFKQSVADNIRIGGRNISDDQVEAAAKAAQCHDFITLLPDGYDTIIGTKGVHLSGGERQRIAIARAIVKDSPIVILDEATAFADPENEHLIHKAFESLMKNKTVVIIAHRLSTIRGADKIIVMDGGKLSGEGTHEELLQAGGKYCDMWRTYSESASWRMAKKKEAFEYV